MTVVVMCTYNGARYVREQLDSILAQTASDGTALYPDKLHILVSDDCSSDGTIEILDEYQSKYPESITVLERPEPSGSAARHFLEILTAASAKTAAMDSYISSIHDILKTADHVMLSDQDDVWNPDKYERTLRKMNAVEVIYGTERPVLVHCDSELVDSQLETISPSFAKYQKMTPSRNKLRQLLVQNNVVGGAMMINRSLLGMINTVPQHCVMHDQWIALIASAFGQIRYVSESLYKYRQHDANVLGAAKGGMVREVLNRLGIMRTDGEDKAAVDAKSHKVYDDLFSQAESFEEIYGSKLPEKTRKEVERFVSLKDKSRLGKIYTILRYGFTYNLPHRTVGECLFM